MNLQKAFDIVDHQILLAKLNYYGIQTWSFQMIGLNPILANRSQYVSINGYDTGLAAVNCDVPQRSVLGPQLFIIIIYKRPESSSKVLQSSSLC